MKKPKMPVTDSIQELAEFWDSHDLTDFEDELEDVAEPVFVRATPIKVRLKPHEVEAVEELAKSKCISRQELNRGWVLQQLARQKTAHRGQKKGRSKPSAQRAANGRQRPRS
jgi:hypothetical protein